MMTNEEFICWLRTFLRALQSDSAEIKVIYQKLGLVAERIEHHSFDKIDERVPFI